MWPANIIDAHKNSISLDQITNWVYSQLDSNHIKDEFWEIIEKHESLIRKRISTISPIIQKFTKKIKTDPSKLLDNIYGNRELSQLKSTIQTKNSCLYHYVKDIDDYIPFLLDDKKLFMAPPSIFKDKSDVNFDWCRDVLDLSINEETLYTLSSIMEFARYENKTIGDSTRLLTSRNTLLNKAKDATRVACLCNTYEDPEMWK